MEHVPTLVDVASRIGAAFPEAPLDASGAFEEWGTTYLDADGFVADSRGRTWRELDRRFLEYHNDALPFLGPSAFARYLPAFLSAVVHDSDRLDQLPGFLVYLLTRDANSTVRRERFDARLARLTLDQQKAVALALTHLEASPGAGNDRQAVTRALDSYWRTLESES